MAYVSFVDRGNDVITGATIAPLSKQSYAERLVTDRFGDFRKLAIEKGTLRDDGTPAMLPTKAVAGAKALASAAGGKSQFMRSFFDDISKIQTSLNAGRANVKLMEEVLEAALQATSQDREKAASDKLQDLVSDTNVHLSEAKWKLEELKARAGKEEVKPGEAKIRSNMEQAMAKKHQQLMMDFQSAQIAYKHALEKRQQREMQLLLPDLAPEERADMIDRGETAALVVAQRMAGAHAMLLDEVQRIREKHQDILRLERSIADLSQMFTEMATLVDAQGEMLDSIEVHVHKAAVCTAKAEQNLIITRKVQHQTQKRMCCVALILMVVLLAIMGPVMLQS